MLIFTWIYAAFLYIASPLYLGFPFFTFTLPLILSLKRLSAPYIVILCLLSGLFIDMFDSSVKMGSHACIMVITALLSLKLSPLFFKDKFSPSFFFSFLISLFVTLQTFLMHAIFGKAVALNLSSFLSELLICPLLDSAFCVSHLFFLYFVKRTLQKRVLAYDSI